jgi:hypothetical protein
MLSAATTTRRARATLAGAALSLATLSAGAAPAQPLTIGQPGEHAPYAVELEPHLAFGLSDPPGPGTRSGIGAGLRASFEIAHVGFVGSIDDSVAIGVGADLLHFSGDGDARAGSCARFVPGPAGTSVCVEVSGGDARSDDLFVPVDLQWNFWLSRRWSVFVEPGLSVYWSSGGHFGASPALFLGGRLHLTPKVSLTLRIGYPTLTLGASFFL